MMADDQGDIVAPDVWAQDTPIGGSADGQLPDAAVATVTVGITTTRELAPLVMSAGKMTVAAATAVSLLARQPQRSRVVLVASAAIYVCDSLASAQSQFGLLLPANTPLELRTAADVFVNGGAAGADVTWLTESHYG